MNIALNDENSSYVTFPERKKNCTLPRSSKRMYNFFPALSKNVNDDLLIADFLVWPPSLDLSVWDWFFDLSGVKISSIDGFKT